MLSANNGSVFSRKTEKNKDQRLGNALRHRILCMGNRTERLSSFRAL